MWKGAQAEGPCCGLCHPGATGVELWLLFRPGSRPGSSVLRCLLELTQSQVH